MSQLIFRGPYHSEAKERQIYLRQLPTDESIQLIEAWLHCKDVRTQLESEGGEVLSELKKGRRWTEGFPSFEQ